MRILYLSFVVFILTFFLFETLKFLSVPVPEWMTSYLNDFLCMPIVFTICLMAVHKIKNDTSYRLRLPLIISLTAFYAIYFETILPEISKRYTGDLLDVVIYFFGAALFYFIQHIDLYINKKAA